MIFRMVERRIKDKILDESPSWKDLQSGDTEVNISAKEFIHKEKDLINELLKNKDIAGLISRYPVRETPVLESISKYLGYLSKEKYEQAVRKMLCDSEEERQKMRDLILPISKLL